MIPLVLAVVLAADVSTAGTATVPLAELIPLINRTEPRPKELSEPVVSRLSLRAHPGEAGLWVDGEVTVRLLSGTNGRVPILRIGADALFEELPATDAAALSVSNGQLFASSRTSAPQTLTFKLLLRASSPGANARAVTLQMAPGMPPAPLRVEVDDSLFDVRGATIVREWGGYVVFPVNGAYGFTWVERSPVARAPEVQKRVPLDPLVTEATGRWVSTLEGRATHDVRLTLQVDRPAELRVDVPEGQTLLSARVNSQPVPVAADARDATLKVSPTTLGGTEAVVELTLRKDLGVFHLSGRVELEAPRVSWPVKRWHSQAILPPVFNYLREGGSMEQVGVESAPTDTDLPGKVLGFTQHLVQATAPNVVLRYSVDISKSYFR